MASTYSTSLKLTLIGDGDQTGTWGQTTNANFGTLLEQAIVGQTTIIMANADYTLTNLNGALDEARGAVLIITGNQNATFSVIVPAVPKLYIVTNNLSGSAIAYIKPSGGNTFQVPYSRTMYLYTNGTTFYALDYVTNAQNLVTGGTITTGAINCTSLTSTGGIIGTTGAFSGAITGTTIGGTTITASSQFTGPGTGITGLPLTTGVTGTLPVANGGTGATTLTSNGVVYGNGTSAAGITAAGTTGQVLIATTSGAPSWGAVPSTAAVTSITFGSTGLTPSTATTGAVTVAGTLAVANGGTGVTTSTGSGNNVLSTSPTLVTPALGTPTSGVLTNATGLPLTTGVTGTLPVANGGTGVTSSTGSGNVVLSTSPTLVTPLLGTPTSGNLANCTFPTLNQNTTGNAATATLATNATNATTAVTVSTTVASGAVGTTQAAGTANTTIATTAFVAAAVAVLYPIGSIYTSTVGTNPNTLFGFGTWVQFAAGKFLMGNGNGSYPIATSSGSADAIVVSHTHTGTTGTTSNDHTHTLSGTTNGQSVSHSHSALEPSGGTYQNAGGNFGSDYSVAAYGSTPNGTYVTGVNSVDHNHTFSGGTSGQNDSHTHAFTTASAGASGTNANLPPYIVVYMWNRTA